MVHCHIAVYSYKRKCFPPCDGYCIDVVKLLTWLWMAAILLKGPVRLTVVVVVVTGLTKGALFRLSVS